MAELQMHASDRAEPVSDRSAERRYVQRSFGKKKFNSVLYEDLLS